MFGKVSKKIKFIVIAVLALVVVGGAIAAAVLIPPVVERNNRINDAKTKIIRQTYRLVVDYRDREGIEIPTAWAQGLPLTDFRYDNDNSFDVAVAGGRLYAPESAQADAQTVITYRLDGVLACVIYAQTVSADGYVSTSAELAALNGSTGTYIQSADILLEGPVSVADFRGKFYANHHVISGLDVGANGGGLFKNTRSATLSGIALTNVTGEIDASAGGSFGALVNSASYTTIEYCSAEGGFTVKNAAGNCNVGGLAGYLLGSLRSVDEDPNVDTLDSCTVNLQLLISGGGNLCAGGIAGKSDNVSIANTAVRGKITLDIPDAYAVQKVYVGGMYGSMYKEYNRVYQIHYLDFSHHLYMYADIVINLTGGGPSVNNIHAGGAFGSIVNQSLDTVKCTGSITINGGAPDLIIGGVCGIAENEMYETYSAGSIEMILRAFEVTGAITVASVGRLYAGGLLGLAKKTAIEETVATVTPQVTVDRGGALTEISETAGHTET